MIVIIIIIVIVLISAQETSDPGKQNGNNEIKIHFERVDEINRKYPGLLTPKKIRTIKARLADMPNGVSVLMLLGKSRDGRCNSDPTFCIGRTLANVTQAQFGYIDASEPNLHSDKIERELSSCLGNQRYTVMIDSLEKLPGTEVMSLFQFIDGDESNQRRGLLLFVVYTGVDSNESLSKMKEAEVAETILAEKWSQFVPRDSLTSVISRMCRTVVKIH